MHNKTVCIFYSTYFTKVWSATWTHKRTYVHIANQNLKNNNCTIPGETSQYYDCWCPGPLRRLDIISHGTYYAWWTPKSLRKFSILYNYLLSNFTYRSTSCYITTPPPPPHAYPPTPPPPPPPPPPAPVTYQVLYHVDSISPHEACEFEDIDLAFSLGLVQQIVQGKEGPCPTYTGTEITSHHDDVIKWKLFPRYWPFVRGIHRSPVNSPHKGQRRGALMFSLICIWING